jgi:hypothetical protein
MGETSVGSIGVADDVGLVSPDPHALQSLLNLSQSLTTSRCMINVQEKTKLLLFHPKSDHSADYWQEVSPNMMNGAALPLSSQAEHVGVLRCTSGTNLASITARMAGHTKSLYSVISCDMARSHRGNPAAGLRVESTTASRTPGSPRSEVGRVKFWVKMLIPRIYFLKILTPFLGSIYIATLIFTRNIIINVKIEFSLRQPVLTLLFQAARVWYAHRARMRMLGLEYYLK